MIDLIFAFVLTLVHAIAPRIEKLTEKHHKDMLSLSAGMFLAFLFLELFEELHLGAVATGAGIYFYALAGFSVFHLANRYIYVHADSKKERQKEMEYLHFAGFGIDGVFAGFAIAATISVFGVATLPITAGAFILHTLAATLSLQHLHEKFESRVPVKIFMALTPILGVLFYRVVVPMKELFYPLLAFTFGLILYLSVRNLLPAGKRGNPLLYLAGVILGVILIYAKI